MPGGVSFFSFFLMVSLLRVVSPASSGETRLPRRELPCADFIPKRVPVYHAWGEGQGGGEFSYLTWAGSMAEHAVAVESDVARRRRSTGLEEVPYGRARKRLPEVPDSQKRATRGPCLIGSLWGREGFGLVVWPEDWALRAQVAPTQIFGAETFAVACTERNTFSPAKSSVVVDQSHRRRHVRRDNDDDDDAIYLPLGHIDYSQWTKVGDPLTAAAKCISPVKTSGESPTFVHWMMVGQTVKKIDDAQSTTISNKRDVAWNFMEIMGGELESARAPMVWSAIPRPENLMVAAHWLETVCHEGGDAASTNLERAHGDVVRERNTDESDES
ncbi:hypothetical protein BDZ88DRAFT_470181 [Geranomyces variabilis]|nr:hypothetical protein BDZ88DRAFT_470181 [Geranomyces variabilis]